MRILFMRIYSFIIVFILAIFYVSCSNSSGKEKEIIEELSSDYAVRYGFCKDSNHPHQIDLGLPSGVKWSCCNLDAEIPFIGGRVYSWEGIQIPELLENYKYPYVKRTGTLFDPFDEYYFLMNDIALSEYDAAHTKWGEKWRLPNIEHFQELLDNCVIEKVRLYVEHNGEEAEVPGYTITGKNKNKIFLRSNGYFQFHRQFTGYVYYGTRACYWSSTHCESDTNTAGYYFELWDNQLPPGYISSIGVMDRKYGLPIRPIFE